jgi:hypothetical protein
MYVYKPTHKYHPPPPPMILLRSMSPPFLLTKANDATNDGVRGRHVPPIVARHRQPDRPHKEGRRHSVGCGEGREAEDGREMMGRECDHLSTRRNGKQKRWNSLLPCAPPRAMKRRPYRVALACLHTYPCQFLQTHHDLHSPASLPPFPPRSP